ncbi:energy-coupling factor transport system ATP-binding protein [Bacilli bacterium PM5-3]|nr:energy-coupling factor transport system ATP-binding protein [Bacilli bacterium PM5-3]MDH6603459.1 energy-coupling factor transport system ATP-binding protein [Bacilli bacterium PM5-9]
MIKVKNLNFSYATNDTNVREQVLKDVSLEIKKNSHTCILGHNGSGKSTLAKLLVGLDFCESGEIEIDGIKLNENNVHEIRDLVGIVFQNPDNQFIGATVQDDIAFGLENHCIPTEDMPKIIDEFASKVGMKEYLSHEPTRLSGGQKQRVAIAGILAMNPKIMIFDEATSMLDPAGVIEVNESIDNLNIGKDRTIISITHDIDYALKTDYVIVLDKGEVLFEGKPKEIFKNSKKLVEIGLDIPFALKISNKLKEDGIKIDDCLSIKELEQQLCQLK